MIQNFITKIGCSRCLYRYKYVYDERSVKLTKFSVLPKKKKIQYLAIYIYQHIYECTLKT